LIFWVPDILYFDQFHAHAWLGTYKSDGTNQRRDKSVQVLGGCTFQCC